MDSDSDADSDSGSDGAPEARVGPESPPLDLLTRLALEEDLPQPPRFTDSEPRAWTDDELHPADPYAPIPGPEPLREDSLDPSYAGAVIGQLLALGIGAAMGALAFDMTRCELDPMRTEWEACGQDRVFAIAIGAALMSPLGAAAGAVVGGRVAGQHGNAADPFWVAPLAGLLFSVLGIPAWGLSDEPMAGVTVAHLAGNMLSSFLAALAYDGHWLVAARIDPDAAVLEASTAW